MWRHLRMLKRGGRSYDASGVDGTSPGELAVLCPACPIPSINLPPNWKSAGRDSEYVAVYLRFDLVLKLFVPGISITNRLASTHASASRGGRYQAMTRIQNWVQATHISLGGIYIASTWVVSPTKQKLVQFQFLLMALTDRC